MSVAVSAIVSQLIARTGARPLVLTGAAVTAGGMYWFSHLSVHATYLGGLLGPSLVTGAGLGLLFVPLSRVTLAGGRDEDSGLASSLLSTGQQVGGAAGLAVLGTITWTVVANSLHSQAAHAARAAAAAGRSGRTAGSGPAPLELSPCAGRGHQPGAAGRLRDRTGRAAHRGHHHPGPPGGPGGPGGQAPTRRGAVPGRLK